MAWAVHRSRRYGASISHTTPHINPQLPPTPPVDPDNVEFVVFVRSKKVNTASLAFVVALHMGACLHTYLHACVVPPCLSSTINDLNHPLHIAQLPKWVPLSIIKGGTSANMLVKSLESDWGNKMFKGQLVNNIGAALYKVGAVHDVFATAVWHACLCCFVDNTRKSQCLCAVCSQPIVASLRRTR